MFPTNPRQVSRLSENTWAREHAANETEAGPHHLIKTSCGGGLIRKTHETRQMCVNFFAQHHQYAMYRKTTTASIILSLWFTLHSCWLEDWPIPSGSMWVCLWVCCVCAVTALLCVCVALQAARSRGSCELKGRDRLAPSPGKCTEQEERVWLKASFGKTDSAGAKELYIFTTTWQLVMGDGSRFTKK